MARVKTRYVGVYTRTGKNRILSNGKPDKCFDILYTVNGRSIWEKVGWLSEGYRIFDAVELRAVRIREHRNQNLFVPPPSAAPKPITTRKGQPIEPALRPGATIQQVWEKYQAVHLPQIKDPKLQKVSYHRYIAPLFADRGIDTLTKLDAERLKTSLLAARKKDGEPISKAYLNRILDLFNTLLKKAYEWELTTEYKNLIKHVQYRRSESDRTRERFLSQEEASRLLDGLSMTDCATYQVVKISLYTGMRFSEISEIKSQNIDLEAKTLTIDSKTGQRTVLFHESLLPLFTLLKASRKGACFPQKAKIRNTYKGVVDAIGFNEGVTDTRQKVVFHTLRHTFCSWLAMRGVPLYTISQLAGHKNLKMTQRYAKLSPDTQRKALDVLTEM